MTHAHARIDVTLASAGTGKTTAIVGTMADRMRSSAEARMTVAMTFTKKAAAELIERVRSRLVADGRQDDALAMLEARLGTVNSVCGRLVADFAFELGQSPLCGVVPEQSADLLFATAADVAIAASAAVLNRLSELLGLPDQQVDWRDHVRRVVDLSRSNGISLAAFPACADRSVEGLLTLLNPPGDGSADGLDDDLAREVADALASIEGLQLKQTSRAYVTALRTAQGHFRRGEQLPWPLWARLSKIDAAKADAGWFADVGAAAARHAGHPRLRHDVEVYIREVFRCAAAARSAYQDHKSSRGLLDYTDQETLALEILREPANNERLQEMIGSTYLDEMQDSSPLQVAIFAELTRHASGAMLVGDPKQTVYGFRAADPALAIATARGAARDTGGCVSVLSKSWRSRPGICSFINAVFVPAFEAMGIERGSVAFDDAACDDAGMSRPPLSVWHLEGKTKSDHAAALASGIVEALSTPGDWPVRDGGGVRALRPGDIAVLCRANADVADVADALSRSGVPVAVERAGLLDVPEIQLTLACLRWTVDRADQLALAEIVRFVSDPADPDAWLRALGEPDPCRALSDLIPFAPELEATRERLSGLTPAESLDAVVLATGVVEICTGWGDAAERFECLEALRGCAMTYEEHADRLRAPATLSGFLSWIRRQAPRRPASSEPEAVQVMTYHAAKGLEWPMVVMGQLDRPPKSSPFAVAAECDGAPEWRAPLDQRWIRVWVWPYGAQSKDVHLDASARADDVGRRAQRLCREEAVRLLYVGMTRPRDHLVLTRPASRPAAWLDVLAPDGGPVLELPDRGSEIVAAGVTHPAVIARVAGAPSAWPRREEKVHIAAGLRRAKHPPLRRRPSDAEGTAGALSSATQLGDRLPLTGSVEMDVLGDALHAVLAADRPDESRELRLAAASATLSRWQVGHCLSPASAILAADRLGIFLQARFPGATVRREAPIHAKFGFQEVAGRIDLLIEATEGFAIVDHKAFPGRRSHWHDKAVSYGPQLAAYADAVALVSGKPCIGVFVHMPIVGTIIEIRAAGPSKP